jgi:nicotinamide mononucleotide transporter
MLLWRLPPPIAIPARVNALEVIATLLGVANILLLVRRSIWNYPFGLAMVAITALVVFRQHLYSDTILQLFFFAAQLYGWWAWWKAGGVDKPIAVERLGWPARIAWVVGIALVSAIWGGVMHLYTNAAMPWLDASLTAASMAAQVLLARRLIENWLLWIIVDVGTVYMYVSKDLYWFGGLYILFLLVSVVGLVEWARAEGRQAAAGA